MNTHTHLHAHLMYLDTLFFLRKDDTLVSSLAVKRSLFFVWVGIQPYIMPHDPVTQQ